MTKATIEYIVERVVENAKTSKEDKKSEFVQGKMLAYYEILDIIKNELIAHDQSPEAFGIDFDLEKFFIG